MNTTGLVILAAIIAAAPAAMFLLFRPWKPAAAATPATKRRARAPDDIGPGSTSPDDAAVPLLALYAHDVVTSAGHASPNSCDRSAAPSSHSDLGGHGDSGSCGGH